MIGRTNAGSGEGGLLINVVGGLSQPTNPREGTIWVKTSSEKPDYIISESQPGSPSSGLAWIKLGSDGVSLPVDKKGTLAINLSGCTVYSGTAWDNVDAWVYTGGQWVQFSPQKYYLIKNGVIVAPSAGWGGRATTDTNDEYTEAKAPTISNVSGGLKIYVSGKEYIRSLYVTNAQIDITKYTKLCVDKTDVSGYGRFGVAKTYDLSFSNSGGFAASCGIEYEGYIDLSELSGAFYVAIMIGSANYSASVTIKNIWLE